MCVSFAVVDGTLVMLASVVHEIVKYYRRPKQSSNKIRILQQIKIKKIKTWKKTHLTYVTKIYGNARIAVCCQ